MLPQGTKFDVGRMCYAVTMKAINQIDCVQTKNDKEARIIWWDGVIPMSFFLKVLPHQRINKFPGMATLCYKSSTFSALNSMKALYPKTYSFFPTTYILPFQFQEFQKDHIKRTLSSQSPVTWIFKPKTGCSGNGIMLTQNSFEFSKRSFSGVVQNYITPYLIDGYKFDFRLYIFVPTIDPFTVYLYREGIARFCTDKYEKPSEFNLSDRFCHLSNTAVNIENKNARNTFMYNASRILAQIRRTDPRGKTLWAKIKHVVMLTMVAQYPHIVEKINMNESDYLDQNTEEEEGNEAYPSLPYSKKFFQILGIDILINEDCEPVVLELNDRPSMATTFQLEDPIKTNLNLEAMRMISVDGSPPDEDTPTGKWEKLLPIDESTQLGMGIRNIMNRSLRTIKTFDKAPHLSNKNQKASAISRPTSPPPPVSKLSSLQRPLTQFSRPVQNTSVEQTPLPPLGKT